VVHPGAGKLLSQAETIRVPAGDAGPTPGAYKRPTSGSRGKRRREWRFRREGLAAFEVCGGAGG